ncbi:hypothetical protein DFR49_2284 [Hephaestia caeni]|uniref:Uncharacterized protein n=1 Tax=Hephaestia caeni TaxID=645617 RepID=A0A397P578_9SPHN|nr:hypothetical protein [Hephaestia caeni]RIA44048.1 hypothetical protein DFR49_2284 [Hephaestia caeni]
MSDNGPALIIVIISLVSAAVCGAFVAAGVLPWWAIAVALFAGPLAIGVLGFLFVAALLFAWMSEGSH